MAVALDPTVCTSTSMHYVDVEVASDRALLQGAE